MSSSNFISEEFRIAGNHPNYSLGFDFFNGDNYYNNGSNSIVIPLTHSPKPDQISVIIDNVRINKSRYNVSGNQLFLNLVNFGNFANQEYYFFIDYHY